MSKEEGGGDRSGGQQDNPQAQYVGPYRLEKTLGKGQTGWSTVHQSISPLLTWPRVRLSLYWFGLAVGLQCWEEMLLLKCNYCLTPPPGRPVTQRPIDLLHFKYSDGQFSSVSLHTTSRTLLLPAIALKTFLSSSPIVLQLLSHFITSYVPIKIKSSSMILKLHIKVGLSCNFHHSQS